MRDSVDYELAARAAGLTLAALFDNSVRSHPQRIAVEEGGRQLTYRQLDARSTRLANVLAGKGVGRGDRVAILSENRSEYIELLLAVAKLGAIAACQNWRLLGRELSHCIELVAPKLLLTSARHEDMARQHAGRARVLVFGPEYEAALERAADTPVAAACDPEDGVVILYTSGTTGLPKGALISQRAQVARAMVQLVDLPTTADDAFVAWAPLFHMVSTDTVFMKLIQGGKVIVVDGFDADGLAQIAAREKLGRFTVMPGMITPLLDAMTQGGHRAAGVRWVGVMADLVPREQIAAVTRTFQAPYLNTFGSTETGLPPASRSVIPVGVVPKSLDKKINSFCEIKLVDADDATVPDGEPGELAIRGPTLFSGYWNNPEANAEDFRGGWFHMGDVFRRNADGTLSFVDRKKYLIKSGGENIYPAEIEQIILADPRVADAVVVRKTDDKWGEIPVAFVVRKSDALSEDALIALCKRHIAGYKVPKEVRFVSEDFLPRSTTGKIKRFDLEKIIESELS